MTSLVKISVSPAYEATSDEGNDTNSSVKLGVKLGEVERIEKLLSLKDKMQELKRRSDSLDDLWAVYDQLDSAELKRKLKVKIAEKTQVADGLATLIQRSLELDQTKKDLLNAKYETDVALQRSPLSSPRLRSKRSFFGRLFTSANGAKVEV